MSNLLTKCHERLLEVVSDGTSITWQQALERAGDMRELIDALAFGKPDTVSRNGNMVVCNGKVKASKVLSPEFEMFAATTVKFTIDRVGDKLLISEMSGIDVRAFGLAQFPLNAAEVTIESDGDVYLRTKKFLMWFTLVIGMDGTQKRWYPGR